MALARNLEASASRSPLFSPLFVRWLPLGTSQQIASLRPNERPHARASDHVSDVLAKIVYPPRVTIILGVFLVTMTSTVRVTSGVYLFHARSGGHSLLEMFIQVPRVRMRKISMIR